MNLYYSLIYSHMAYGILAWGKCGTYSRDRIDSLQNRSLRILNLNFNTHKILNFELQYEYLALIKLFKIQNLRNHDYYYQKLMLIPQHNQQTRSLTFKNFNTPFFNKSNPKSFLFIKPLMLGIILSYKSRTPTHYQHWKMVLKINYF